MSLQLTGDSFASSVRPFSKDQAADRRRGKRVSTPRRSISYAVANCKPEAIILPDCSHNFSGLGQVTFRVDLRDVGVAVTQCHLSRFQTKLPTDLGRGRMP